jgi:hypothetical protein
VPETDWRDLAQKWRCGCAQLRMLTPRKKLVSLTEWATRPSSSRVTFSNARAIGTGRPNSGAAEPGGQFLGFGLVAADDLGGVVVGERPAGQGAGHAPRPIMLTLPIVELLSFWSWIRRHSRLGVANGRVVDAVELREGQRSLTDVYILGPGQPSVPYVEFLYRIRSDTIRYPLRLPLA